MIKKLSSWFSNFFSKSYRYRFIDEVPDKIEPYIVYLIEHEGYYWQAVMICPCGCKKHLHMNLISDHKPYWQFKIDKSDHISLSPSIHRMIECRSHFFVRKGKIIWA